VDCEEVRLTQQGNYLLDDPPLSALINPSKTITYFPLHALPLHAPTRFADLFLTRQRWRPEDMTPFLRGLTRDGDKKERDKLIVKFVRVVKDKDGVWWHPRRTG
jgi:sister chromatid cohesion protein DCC1